MESLFFPAEKNATERKIYMEQANNEQCSSELERAKQQLLQAFNYLYEYGGFGHLEVDMKILKRG